MTVECGNGWTMHHGDCLVVMQSIGEVDHVVTDPPYTDRTSRNARSAPDGVGGQKLSEARAFITFDGVDSLEAAIASATLRLASRWVIIFCALEQIGAYEAACGDAWIRATAWLRTNSAPQFTGDRPGQAHEGICIAHRPGRKRWNRGGHSWAPVGETINGIRNAERGQLDHPTPKPLWIMLDAVAAFTDPGETILDPFAGSGTTGVACLRLGRRFIGIERDPKYFRLACDRLRAEEQGSTLQAQRAGQMPLLGGVK